MRKVKNRDVSRIKCVSIFLLALCFSVAQVVSPARAGDIKQWNNVREYVADIGDAGIFGWCGKNEIAVMKRMERNSSVFAFYKNDLAGFKEETINAGIGNYWFGCSNDGQFIYYAKRLRKSTGFKDFYCYDRKNQGVRTVFSADKEMPSNIFKKVISPQRNYIIAPSHSGQLMLPGTGNVKVIPFDALVGRKASFIDIDWDPFDRKIYLLDGDSQILSVIDSKTLQKENVKVKIAKYEVKEVRATINPQRVFLIAYHFDDSHRNVYLLDLSNKEKRITPFLSNIDNFEVLSAGRYVYSKTYGFKNMDGNYEFAPEASKRYKSINIADSNRKIRTVKRIYFGSSNVLPPLPIEPIISSDGSSMAFVERDVSTKKNRIYVIHSK